jgi:hypothetical protein
MPDTTRPGARAAMPSAAGSPGLEVRRPLARERVEVIPGPDGVDADAIREERGWRIAPGGVLRPQLEPEFHRSVCFSHGARHQASGRHLRDREGHQGPRPRLLVGAGCSRAARHHRREGIVAACRRAPHPRLLVRPHQRQPRPRTPEVVRAIQSRPRASATSRRIARRAAPSFARLMAEVTPAICEDVFTTGSEANDARGSRDVHEAAQGAHAGGPSTARRRRGDARRRQPALGERADHRSCAFIPTHTARCSATTRGVSTSKRSCGTRVPSMSRHLLDDRRQLVSSFLRRFIRGCVAVRQVRDPVDPRRGHDRFADRRWPRRATASCRT